MAYDYVVVGAGSAGCVVAARLSEDPSCRVLLIEAGPRKSDLRVSAPGLVAALWRTKYDWGFRTTPQRHMHGRRGYWPRGKVVGGTSCLNYMIYIRGHRADYDRWNELGNDGWGYDDVLPYFTRSEDNALGAGPYHGAGGPLRVQSPEAPAEIGGLMAEAAAEVCGTPLVDDLNTPEREGFGPYQLTVRDSRRCSTAVAFLEPAASRPNLDVITDALVERIVVKNRRATGVRYRKGGRVETARADGEIVLCAGAIGTPHVLLLSGIGPSEELRKAGVDVVHDLPGVGKNLRDHLYGVTGYEVVSRASGTVNPLTMIGWLGRYLATRGGPLTSAGCDAGGFVRVGDGAPIPDLQFHFLSVAGDPVALDDVNFEPKGRACSILPTLIYPKSVGELRLANGNPQAAPIIDPRYFEDESDLETLFRGVKITHDMVNSAPLREHLGKGRGPASDPRSSDDEIRRDLRARSSTIFHPVGTCKMGRDELAVVDPELRVRGVERLRVADASIMPTIIGGNTNAPTIMIGEKASDLLRSPG